MYVVCSDVFNEVASVARLANGLVGFDDGAGAGIGTAELVPWPGCGCDVTGLPVSISVKSSCMNRFLKMKIERFIIDIVLETEISNVFVYVHGLINTQKKWI